MTMQRWSGVAPVAPPRRADRNPRRLAPPVQRETVARLPRAGTPNRPTIRGQSRGVSLRGAAFCSGANPWLRDASRRSPRKLWQERAERRDERVEVRLGVVALDRDADQGLVAVAADGNFDPVIVPQAVVQ